ncbi:MAG: DUF2189 domain-containing protein [Azospirillaceae bacterium]|nr:DUF2189 domain-containing protein [Azospirillaceae bacterium]
MTEAIHHTTPPMAPGERSGDGGAAVPIRRITPGQQWQWLAAGWEDFVRAPGVSLAYGALLVIASFILIAGLALYDLGYLILPMAAGFMLVGPVIAVGLYDTSRRLERGEPVSLGTALAAFHSHSTQIAAIGVVLMIGLLFWIRCALLLFALFFAGTPAPLDAIYTELFFSLPGVTLIATGTVIGAGFAIVAFAASAVSIPMLLDRDVDVITAVITSLRSVRDNLVPMVLWGLLVTLLTMAGIATAFLGLAVTLPVIAYASWHAYRDLVGPI